MCGRYYFDIELKELKEIADSVEENLYGEFRTGEIYPGSMAPILTSSSGGPRAVAALWGLPKWNKKGIVINARSETVLGKPMFKKLTESGRCIVPASCFFEWSRRPGSGYKEKFRFRQMDMPLYMAGLCKEFSQEPRQLSLFSGPVNNLRYTILTKEADEVVAEVHDRMPVILDREGMLGWLAGKSLASVLAAAVPILVSEPEAV